MNVDGKLMIRVADPPCVLVCEIGADTIVGLLEVISGMVIYGSVIYCETSDPGQRASGNVAWNNRVRFGVAE